jgi:hypothetical protein
MAIADFENSEDQQPVVERYSRRQSPPPTTNTFSTSPSPTQPDHIIHVLLVTVHAAANRTEMERPPAHTAYAWHLRLTQSVLARQ